MDGISQKAAQKASFAEIPQPRYSGKILYSTTKKVYYVKFTTHYAIHYSYLFISIHYAWTPSFDGQIPTFTA